MNGVEITRIPSDQKQNDHHYLDKTSLAVGSHRRQNVKPKELTGEYGGINYLFNNFTN